MDLSQIQILNYILFSLLVILICYFSYKRIDKRTPLIFTLSVCMFPVIPYSLQFSSVFYISYIASIIILFSKRSWLRKEHLYPFFLVIGGLTSYFDLLTAPIVTLEFPLIFYTLLEKEKHFREVLFLSVTWLLGYCLMWGTKWLLAYILTDVNIIMDAINQTSYRIGSNSDLYLMFQNKTILLMFFIMFILVLLSLVFRKDRNTVKKNLWLLFIAIIPVGWLIICKEHTSIHYGFAWRNLYVSLFAILLFIIRSTDVKKYFIYERKS